MGRSVNSRNRVFIEDGDGIRTQAFDPSKLEDPHLIIYAPVRVLGDKTIVTNGDQTDTIYEHMENGQTFEQSLRTREFEDDDPNFTPRISGIIEPNNGGFDYSMSILKSADGNPQSCQRYTFRITIRLTARDTLSIHIWVTAVRFRLLRASLKRLQFQTILMNSQTVFGIRLMRIIKFRCS